MRTGMCSWMPLQFITACEPFTAKQPIAHKGSFAWQRKTKWTIEKTARKHLSINLCANAGALWDARFCDILFRSLECGNCEDFSSVDWILRNAPVDPLGDNEDSRIENDWPWTVSTFSVNCLLSIPTIPSMESVEEIRIDKKGTRKRNHGMRWVAYAKDKMGW